MLVALTRVRLALAVGFLALGFLPGCAVEKAGGPGASESIPDTDTVRQRAQERWDALVGGNIEKAYGFLSPGTRQANTLAAYKSSVRQGFWKKVLVERVVCPEKDVCEAYLQVEYFHRGSRITTPMRESWVRSEGQWWYVLQ